MTRRKPPHTPTTPNEPGVLVRITNSDAMTAVTRVCMVVTSALVALLVWYAQTIITHIDLQDKKIADVTAHQIAEDGTNAMLAAMAAETSTRLTRLENVYFEERKPNGR